MSAKRPLMLLLLSTALSLLILSGGIRAASLQDFAPLSGEAGKIQNADLYWIAFSGDSDNDPVFLMQIDAGGNVTRPPKAIFQAGKFGFETGTIALGKNGPNRLNFWHWGKFNILYRGIVNTVTMNPIGLKKLAVVTTDDDTLQVTQKPSGNFLIVEVPGRQLKAFPVAPTGLVSGPSYDLAPKAPRVNDEGSISSDGRAVTANRNTPDVPRPPADQIFVQMLDAAGKPTGDPRPMATSKDIEASDVTSAMPGNKRFVVYVVDQGSKPPENQLFLQVIGRTGNKLGPSKLINVPPTRDQDDQNVAIDPLGRFVVFTIGGNNFGCPGKDILVYQALNASGAISGPLKAVARCGIVPGDIVNIDILKE